MNSIMKKAAIAFVAAAAICLEVGPAAASSPYTGSAGPVTATFGGQSSSCQSSLINGNATSVTAPAQMGDIVSSMWTNCSGIGAAATWSQNGVWQIWATGAPVGGLAPVEIRNFDLTIVAFANGCTIRLTGTAGGTWNNGTQTLNLTGTSTLNVASSATCFGVTGPGSFRGSYAVSATSGPIVIL
jgi:hypothetical protein